MEKHSPVELDTQRSTLHLVSTTTQKVGTIMARLNTKTSKPRNGATKLKSTGKATINHQGGVGFLRDEKTELFLAAVSALNEDTFYESAQDRRGRIATLIEQVAQDTDWILGLVGWLRKEAGLRTIPSIIAAHAVKARLDKGINGSNRAIISAALGRMDENAEILAYWLETFGRTVPSAVKRGVSDSFLRGLNQNSYLKWRGKANRGAVSLVDVINLTHPKPTTPEQSALLKLVIDEAYGNDTDISDLPVIQARDHVLSHPAESIVKMLSGPDAESIIKDASLTHEVIAGAVGKIPAEVWENLVPTMGYKALRMNLRRIHESGVSDDVIDTITSRLKDAEVIRKSNPMPIEFLAAFRNAPLDFAPAIQRAANYSLENVPALDGRTLILVDTSGSMGAPLSERGTLARLEAARVFGAALAIRAENPTLVTFGSESKEITVKGKDLLRVAESITNLYSGTETADAIDRHYDKHDRVIVITDEQPGYSYWSNRRSDVFENIPENVPTFTWNLAGYRTGHSEIKVNRYTFGGLTDKGFQMIPLLETGLNQGWPWESK